ncbi:hypothetical protein [Paenibacillus validus]|uniref:hypothetical protein n=1 Tax=Paenibacillus validus TaxID=44253 RepID=UPI003D273269
MLQGAGIPSVLAEAVVNGFFEVTLGAKEAGSAIGIPPMYKAAIAAWVLSWAGLSVHAQIVSVLHRTPVSLHAVLHFARFVHGLLAGRPGPAPLGAAGRRSRDVRAVRLLHRRRDAAARDLVPAYAAGGADGFYGFPCHHAAAVRLLPLRPKMYEADPNLSSYGISKI